MEASQHISLQRHFSSLWNCSCRSERNGAIFSPLTWAALQTACPHQNTQMFQLHLWLSLLSTPLLFRGETNPPSVPEQYILHLEFWLGWHFLKYTYIFRVRQLPGDYYTAADAEGHKLFLQRSTLPYTKKLSSWPFILPWLPHCEQVMNFYDFTTSHWSYYEPLGEKKWGGGKSSQTAYRHLKMCPFCFTGWH